MADDTRGLLDDLRARTGTRAEQLAALLEERTRDLAPGAPMGTIEDIRLESGLARATVSEAIRLLRDRGALTIRPGRGGGLFVADQGPVVRMRHTLLDVRDDPSAVADAIELRTHLEELIAVGAARCRDEDGVAALRGHLADMAGAADWTAFVRANWALHERIARMCPNAMARAVYVSTLGHLTSSTTRLGDQGAAAAAYRTQRLRIHADLVDAIATGDEDAVRETIARHNRTD